MMGRDWSKDYEKAFRLGLATGDRFGCGADHHPMSKRMMVFLRDHDYEDYGDYFCWRVGGDGDNGETLMYQMDAFFELLDSERINDYDLISCQKCEKP